MNFPIALRIFLFSFLLLGVAVFIAGCSSPQERCGVSNIPFNTPNDQGSRTFEGGL